MKGRITKRAVDALKVGTSSRFLWDGTLPGFGLRITPNGVRSYVLQYEIGGRSRRMTIGRHGAPWTPSSARQEAIRLRGQIANGEDPAELKKSLRQAETVKELAERYLDAHAVPKKKARSVVEDRRILDKVILPKLGRRKIKGVTRADIARLHHDLRETPYSANRVLSLLSKMFNVAESWGLRSDKTNPCNHIERFQEYSRERFLSVAELQRLGAVLAGCDVKRTRSSDSFEGASDSELRTEPWQAIAAIRLLLFTGCRLGEILSLQWQHVDTTRGCLVLRDSKTGPKTVLLPAPALSVLNSLPRVDESLYVLPAARGKGHFVGVPHIWRRLRDEANLCDVRLHDFRHTFASVGAIGGESLIVIGALLGHRQPVTTARYAHLSDDPLRDAVNRVAGTIATALKGEDASGGDVVNMAASKGSVPTFVEI